MSIAYFRALALACLCAVMCQFSGVISCSAATSSDTTTTFPATCSEAKEAAVEETGEVPANGTYTLYIDGDEAQPWDAYCYNMSRAEPIEFLTVEESENVSQIGSVSGVASTTYTRLRIDPIALTIDPLNNTFSSNDFESFTPTFPTDAMESIPVGWAEYQTDTYSFEAVAAESSVSLLGTPFVFDDSILANELGDFFCQVDSQITQAESTQGTGVEVAADLVSIHLTAINTNSEEFENATTREVADCGDLGSGSDFSAAALPLQYVGE